MATSTWSYRQSTRQTSSAGGGDDSAALRSKLEQARRQRTAFYRRLAETGARAQSDDDGGPAGGDGVATEVDIDVDAETLARRQRERLDASSPYLDVVSSVSSTNASLLEQPEPRSSWRYYTSYDNGEWRRHATPIYKADAELDGGISGKLSERRSASMTAGLTTHDDIIDIDDNEGASSHSRQTSALGRHQRLRGSACLTRDLPPAGASSATDTGPTTLDEVKQVMKDVFDRSRYGSSHDVSELVQKILGERRRHRDPSPPRTEDRVIYANPDRQTILDNVTQPLRPTLLREIPEGGDESEFVEKTLAPSGRRWTSSPSPDSQQVLVLRTAFEDGDDFDAGLRYEDIGASTRVCGTSLENWRDSSCRSPSNGPDMVNGEAVEARWSGALGAGEGRTTETTSRHERQTVSETTTTSGSGKDALGRRMPADAVEIKVQMHGGQTDRDEERRTPSKSRSQDERNSAAEQWSRGHTDTRSPVTRDDGGFGFVETDKQRWVGGGTARLEDENVGITSSSEEWSRVTGSKSAGKASTDDGRVWIPVLHVSGSPTTSKATKSEVSPSSRPADASPSARRQRTEMVIRSDEAVGDSRRQVDGVTDRRLTVVARARRLPDRRREMRSTLRKLRAPFVSHRQRRRRRRRCELAAESVATGFGLRSSLIAARRAMHVR